jgi:hypothetical protein
MVCRLNPEDCFCEACGGGTPAPEGYFGGTYCPCRCHSLKGAEREAYLKTRKDERDAAAKRIVASLRTPDTHGDKESETLLPCPCCGGRAVYGRVNEDGPNFGGEFVDCTSCGLSTTLMFPMKDSVTRELSEKWNKRFTRSAGTRTEADEITEKWRTGLIYRLRMLAKATPYMTAPSLIDEAIEAANYLEEAGPVTRSARTSTLDEALRRCADHHGDDALLDAPCLFCGYNGAGYWQSGTHAKDCRWHSVGGFDDRMPR